MKRMREFLSAKRTGDIIAISIIFIFAIFAVIRLYPFENTLTAILNGPTDDWNLYARTALDIRQNGILIPSIQGDYVFPNSFLYNYFLALCFLIFGENTIPVFIIQSILLGLSIALIYWTFRSKMHSLTGILFLITLFFFALLDVSKHYSSRFLRNNITLKTALKLYELYGLDFFHRLSQFDNTNYNDSIIINNELKPLLLDLCNAVSGITNDSRFNTIVNRIRNDINLYHNKTLNEIKNDFQ